MTRPGGPASAPSRPSALRELARPLLGRLQVLLYLAAVLVGLTLGVLAPVAASGLEVLVWPALAALLLATFLQTPLERLPAALGDRRFLAAVVLGNFVLAPGVVASLLPLLPADPAIRLGVLLVLLVPCTDWFVTFAHLGGGDAARAIVVTPLNLLLQLALLPIYLRVLAGPAVLEALATGHLVPVVVTLLVLPLLVAWAAQRTARHRSSWRRGLARTEHLPVVLLAVVLVLVAAVEVDAVRVVADVVPTLVAVYALYLAAALLLGRALAAAFRLPARAGRSLTFSLGSRNSFVVLPLALALPEGWHAAVAAIVLQALVELFGMLAFLRIVPRLLPVAVEDGAPA